MCSSMCAEHFYITISNGANGAAGGQAATTFLAPLQRKEMLLYGHMSILYFSGMS